MKRMMAMLLAAMLLMTTPALAESKEIRVNYATTAALVQVLEVKGFTYQLPGVTENGYELVRMDVKDGDCAYTLAFFLTQDLKHVSIRALNIVAFEGGHLLSVMRACNELNRTRKYTRFYADENNTVTAAIDLVVSFDPQRPSAFQNVIWETMAHTQNIIREAYPALVQYRK